MVEQDVLRVDIERASSFLFCLSLSLSLSFFLSLSRFFSLFFFLFCCFGCSSFLYKRETHVFPNFPYFSLVSLIVRCFLLFLIIFLFFIDRACFFDCELVRDAGSGAQKRT